MIIPTYVLVIVLATLVIKMRSENYRNITYTIKDNSGCVEGYGIKNSTVIFFYSELCPHCQNMIPIVKNLESQGYEFYWAQTDSDVMLDCYQNLINDGVPQFICPSKNKRILGEISIPDLKSFANYCR